MAGLQRSTTSFRRQGSSGLVWDDKLLAELNQKEEDSTTSKEEGSREEEKSKEELLGLPHVKVSSKTAGSIERSRSNRGFRTGKVSPAIEPPSPKVSACGFCSAFSKNEKEKEKSHRRPKSGKRKM